MVGLKMFSGNDKIIIHKVKLWDPGTSGFRRIFTVAFLLFQAPAGGFNPAGQSFT